MSKPEREFSPLNNVEWRPVPGYPSGATEKILSADDEEVYTRLLRFEPGFKSTQTLSHVFWEEVYILEGELVDLRTDAVYTAGMYACRPPGMKHGPYASPKGFLGFEVHYYGRKENR